MYGITAQYKILKIVRTSNRTTLRGFTASYYAHRYNGRKTASGERYDMNKLTAAHFDLPFGTRVRVTNLKNGLSVIVRITDRGPFGVDKRGETVSDKIVHPTRKIDLSLAAMKVLDGVRDGVIPMKLEVLD